MRASIGLISDLLVMSDDAAVHQPHLLVSVDKHSSRLDVWDARAAMATAAPTALLDRMTSSIRDVILTDNDSLAFVSANGSDAVAVYDMRSGQMADLMTHEGEVTSFSVTSDGRFMLISLKTARTGQYNKVCERVSFGQINESRNSSSRLQPSRMLYCFTAIGKTEIIDACSH
jgi:WD40 repeat protein